MIFRVIINGKLKPWKFPTLESLDAHMKTIPKSLKIEWTYVIED